MLRLSGNSKKTTLLAELLRSLFLLRGEPRVFGLQPIEHFFRGHGTTAFFTFLEGRSQPLDNGLAFLFAH